jgi:hypothetical protein
MANPIRARVLKSLNQHLSTETVELLRNFRRSSMKSGRANSASIRRGEIRNGELPVVRRHWCFHLEQRNTCLQAHIGEVHLRSFRSLKDRKAEQAGYATTRLNPLALT